MDIITISELAVSFKLGVSEAERSFPQRLLLTIQLGTDFTEAAAGDDLSRTIDYSAVCQRLLHFGEARSWKLLETLASDIANVLRTEFGAATATVEIKKFIIPEVQFVSVRVSR